MRVAVLGMGGLGRALVQELRADPRVDHLLLVDRVKERAEVLARLGGRVVTDARALDVGNGPALIPHLRGCDVVVNATLPQYNLTIMRAALAAGSNYADSAGSGPSRPGGPPGILEQLDMQDEFKAAGRHALLSMGLDPGMTNVLVRQASEKLDTVDVVRIRCGSTVDLPGFSSFPLYSREEFLDDLLLPPTVWVNGRLEEREAMGEGEDFDFPAPIGRRRTYLVSHEEVKTLPRFLGKPVGRVDFKYAVDANLSQALHSLDRLGLLRPNRTIRVGGVRVPFRRAFVEALPEPSALMRPLEGWECVSVEVEGQQGGVRHVFRADITMAHKEANRRRNTTATHYLTAVALAIGTGLVADPSLHGPGVYPPEALNPARILQEWTARGLPVVYSERAS